MTKPRLLVPISLQFSVRYLLRSGLLRQISKFAQPVVLLGWRDETLEHELQEEGCEVHPQVKATWNAEYERARSIMNRLHQRQMNSPSDAIRERRQNLDRPLEARLKRKVRRAAHSMWLSFPGNADASRERELQSFWSDTNARDVEQQLSNLNLDAVFCLTPFLTDEEMAVRVASAAGVPSSTAILSFDNLTTRPWMPMTFDSYLLWNRHNVEHLRRGYPEAAAREVKIVGSPQFDFYWKPEYIWSEEEWRSKLGLPSDRLVILFAGGYFTCAPHEPQFLGHLEDAIEQNQIPGKPIILFRRHPVDPLERWQSVLGRAKHIVMDNPWQLGAKVLGHTNVGTQDISKLASTLYHTSVHVNVASTMTVDGAIFDRPQVGPAYDESPARKYHRSAIECYHQEHFLPIMESGGMSIVRRRSDLIEAVRAGFADPEKLHEGRENIVKEICTFSDGRCCERVASAVQSFVGGSVRRSPLPIPSTV